MSWSSEFQLSWGVSNYYLIHLLVKPSKTLKGIMLLGEQCPASVVYNSVGKTKHFIPQAHVGSFCLLFPSFILPILKSFLFFLSRNHSSSKRKTLYAIHPLLVNFQVNYLCSIMAYPLSRLYPCLRLQEKKPKCPYPIVPQLLFFFFSGWISPTP